VAIDALDEAVESLQLLQRQIWRHVSEVEENDWVPGWSPSLSFFVLGNEGLDLRYFGDSYDDDPSAPADPDASGNYPFHALLDWLIEPRHATLVQSLHFGGPDEGANGIRSWEFARLLQSETVFPQLRYLNIQWGDPADHNLSIVVGDGEGDGMYMREGGALARLLNRMPMLDTLRAPSAPDASFFEGPVHSLRVLEIQSGTGHQGFIANLARSRRFSNLKMMDYDEVCPWFIETEGSEAELAECLTSESDFQALFESPVMGHLRHLTLRGTRLTPEQLVDLQARCPKLQFLYVPLQGNRYVSHWQRHLQRIAAQ